MTDINISVEYGDALEFRTNLLVVKYAQNLYGVDKAVFERFLLNGRNLSPQLPSISDSFLIQTNGIMNAEMVLFIGVPPLGKFGLSQIQAFGLQAIIVASEQTPTIKHLCLTLHGIGVGFDEVSALEAEIDGVLEAIADGRYPKYLNQITIVERNAGRTKRLQARASRIFIA